MELGGLALIVIIVFFAVVGGSKSRGSVTFQGGGKRTPEEISNALRKQHMKDINAALDSGLIDEDVWAAKMTHATKEPINPRTSQ